MAKNPNGAGWLNNNGYVRFRVNGKEKSEHVHVVEQALNKPLPPNAVVHHINGIRNDNRKENLVVCPSHEYHRMIHKREAAFDACGHADWLKCGYCGEYDDPSNMYVKPSGLTGRHRACANEYQNKRKALKLETEGVMK